MLGGASAGAGELLMDTDGRHLSVSLRVPQTAWVPGQMAEVEAVLTNTGAAPFLVDTFGDLNAVYEGKKRDVILVSCWTLSWGPEAIDSGGIRERAPLDAGQFVRLAPGQSYTKRFTFPAPDLPPGPREVRLTYTPRVASPSFSFPEYWLDQQHIREPIWTGLIVSDPVGVRIE